MTYMQKINKYIKIIFLRSENPSSLPEIQASLREFRIEACEVDILKVINSMPVGECELVPVPIHNIKSEPQDRNTKYKSGIVLIRKHHTKMVILNSLTKVEEMHISKVEDQIKRDINCRELIQEMVVEEIVRYTARNFIAISNEGKEYLGCL